MGRVGYAYFTFLRRFAYTTHRPLTQAVSGDETERVLGW
jgi:hypothetical protein